MNDCDYGNSEDGFESVFNMNNTLSGAVLRAEEEVDEVLEGSAGEDYGERDLRKELRRDLLKKIAAKLQGKAAV